MRAYWVGVVKGRFQGHRVFEFDGDPYPKDVPDCDYVVGPYAYTAAGKEEAEKRAKTEKNTTGTFGDPFCEPGAERHAENRGA